MFFIPLIHFSLKCSVIQFVFRRICCVLASLLGMRYIMNKPDNVTNHLPGIYREDERANMLIMQNKAT